MIFVILLKILLYCHFHIDCWQIGDGVYNCEGRRVCE